MNEKWLGRQVSLNCGSLGYIQGIIHDLKFEESRLSLRNPFQNGFACQQNVITLQAADIIELKFLENSSDDEDYTNSLTDKGQQKKTSRTGVAEKLKACSLLEKERREIVEISSPSRRQRDKECFGKTTNGMEPDFDFEKNLALFDKKLVFQEISQFVSNQPDVIKLIDCNLRKPEPKYRSDENVLPSHSLSLTRISLPDKSSGKYVTDSGLIIPAISKSLRRKLITYGETLGISENKVIELMARSSTDLVLQALGGSHRLNPSNTHQLPSTILLCGHAHNGAIGLAIGRHLASYGIQTFVYRPDQSHFSKENKSEFALYQHTGKKWSHCLKDLPTSADLIISALYESETVLDSKTNENLMTLTMEWVSKVKKTQSRIPILSIDPSPNEEPLFSPLKMSILPGWLPLYLSPSISYGRLIMVNLGLPSKLFSDLDIIYSSPYGAKATISLHHTT